jgi:hypothetical protein
MQPKPGAAHSPAPPAVSPSPAAPSPSPKPAQEAEQPLPDARQEAAAAAVIDHLYVIGGLAADNHSLDSILVYVDGTWGPGPRLPLGLDHTAAANLDGQLYIAGGYNNGTASARAFRLNGSSWQELAALRHPRGALALLPFDGHLYAIGGESGGTQVAPVEQYDPVSNGWTDLPVLPLPRNHVAGFVYQGKLCVAGGRPNDTARVDCYDPASRSWSQLPALPRATSGGGAGTLGDEVVVAGGEDTVHSILVDQVFRFSGGAWQSEPMLVPRHGAALALLDGRLWACGGGAAVGLKPVNTCTSIG